MSETATEWPFDARQDDPLTALRIPVVPNPYPGWKYEVALVITGDDVWGPALRPDEAETALLVSYLGYRMSWYNAGWQAKMRKRPLDVDSGTNTTILQKRGEGDWCYRKATWQHGPFMVPSRYDGEEPMGLAALLDRINGYYRDEKRPDGTRELVIFQHWQEWKAAHPETFPGSEG